MFLIEQSGSISANQMISKKYGNNGGRAVVSSAAGRYRACAPRQNVDGATESMLNGPQRRNRVVHTRPKTQAHGGEMPACTCQSARNGRAPPHRATLEATRQVRPNRADAYLTLPGRNVTIPKLQSIMVRDRRSSGTKRVARTTRLCNVHHESCIDAQHS